EVEVRMTQGMTQGMTNDEIRMTNAVGASAFVIRHSSFVILEIHDSGPGPPADIADRLFEPFVTGKPEGVGLGLAVARQVAEAHGGRITWRRDRGVTRFTIELPAQESVVRSP